MKDLINKIIANLHVFIFLYGLYGVYELWDAHTIAYAELEAQKAQESEMERLSNLIPVGSEAPDFSQQDPNGNIELTHSVSAGLDYAAVGPEHAWLRDEGRVEYTYATDEQALAAFMKLARLEGIIPGHIRA